jgi:uncharacterized membrane protein
MELSIATIIGQIIALAVIAAVVYFVALIPISLKRIANELSEIRAELQERNRREG